MTEVNTNDVDPDQSPPSLGRFGNNGYKSWKTDAPRTRGFIEFLLQVHFEFNTIKVIKIRH